MSTPGFDIIGDIHGQYHKLLRLLRHLGYQQDGDFWRCSGRTAVFVGDLIDRGPHQRETLDLVRRMVEAGAARCIMGNHEFNAIAWTLPDPGNPGEYLRPHGKPGNRHQHRAFLDVVEDTPQHQVSIAWFRTLPLWIDLQGVRVVHACWDQPSIDQLRPLMGPRDTLTDDLFILGSQKGHWAHVAIETLCKGPEVELPHGASYIDKEGKRRSEVRIRWWEQDLSTYRKAAIAPSEAAQLIPDEPMPRIWEPRLGAQTPVIFGHYWFSGRPEVISGRFACIDYSAGLRGPLVAYRWDGETELNSNKLAWVPAQP